MAIQTRKLTHKIKKLSNCSYRNEEKNKNWKRRDRWTRNKSMIVNYVLTFNNHAFYISCIWWWTGTYHLTIMDSFLWCISKESWTHHALIMQTSYKAFAIKVNSPYNNPVFYIYPEWSCTHLPFSVGLSCTKKNTLLLSIVTPVACMISDTRSQACNHFLRVHRNLYGFSLIMIMHYHKEPV